MINEPKTVPINPMTMLDVVDNTPYPWLILVYHSDSAKNYDGKNKKKNIFKNYLVFLSSKFTAKRNVETFLRAVRDSKSGPFLSLKCNYDVRNVPKYQGMFK